MANKGCLGAFKRGLTMPAMDFCGLIEGIGAKPGNVIFLITAIRLRQSSKRGLDM